jgi:hypothetical protein
MEYSEYGDSDFLADNDRSIRDFRENEKTSKKHIVKQMVKIRHNLQYNKHLLSVYLKAKTIFDEMVEEHREQIHHLDKIYRHLNKLIHEQITKNKSSKKRRDGGVADNNKPTIKELVKDKRKIGKLLSNMRKGLDKLMEIDTIIGTTVEKINEIQFMEDNDDDDESEDSDEADEDDEADEETEDDDESEEEEEDDEDDDDDDDDEDEEDEVEEDDDEDEDEDESEEEEDDDEAEDEDDTASEEEDEAEDEDDTASEEDDEDDEDDEDSASGEPVVFY